MWTATVILQRREPPVSIIDKISDPLAWEEFLEYKRSSGHLSVAEERDLTAFIEKREYEAVAERIAAGEGLSLPKLREINKKSTGKKRLVFVFPREENYVLKLVAYRLSNEYDRLFPRNLYSFRRGIGVKQAIDDILRRSSRERLYSYKVDISDYFNSVNTDLAVAKMRAALSEDVRCADLIEGILREPRATFGKQQIECRKGIMAGVPVSGFLANLFLIELDEHFARKGVIYARYSDDIIVFSDTEEGARQHEAIIKSHLSRVGLSVNEKKEFRTSPGEPWEFLGFKVSGRRIDISTVSFEKIKAKMRRKARALKRWRERRGAAPEGAAVAFIRAFNRKLFDNPARNDITWSLWYFPTITTDESLREIDRYAVECIRYAVTGRHSKINYRLRYERIKELGFRSLVNAYYKFKEGEELPAEQEEQKKKKFGEFQP